MLGFILVKYVQTWQACSRRTIDFCSCRFEDLLRSLTVERKDICDAMIFALDNADSAFEVQS